MALITANNFRQLYKSSNNVHKSVEATYTTFQNKGRKYIQIDTYGSSERKLKGKASQSIQLDEDMAKLLLDVLKKEFIKA